MTEFKHPADAPEQEITSEAVELNELAVASELTAPPAETAAFNESESETSEPTEGARPGAKLERLQKVLAQAGVASRRHAEELITQGRVQVNGQTVTVLGSKADPSRDHIRVDGKLLHGAERRRYFVLNKPKGYVTSVTDPEGRPTVMQFFAKLGERLYPVGRLDYQSEGLLLVTNDGELANQLTKAASGVEKTYLVKVAGRPSEAMIDRLRKGIAIDKDKLGSGKVHTAPARIRQVRSGENPWYEVVLIEGRNRELRKMFEEIGHHVEKIRRVGYGPMALDVEPGKIRELNPDEVRALQLTAEGKLKPRPVKSTYFLPKDAGLTPEQRTAKAARAKKSFSGGDGRRDREWHAHGRRGEEAPRGRGEESRPGRPGESRPWQQKPPGARDGQRPFGKPRSGRPEAASKAGRAAPASHTRSAGPGFTRDDNRTNRGEARPWKQKPAGARDGQRPFGKPLSGRPEATPKAGRAAPASRARSAGPGFTRDDNRTNRGESRPWKQKPPGARDGQRPFGKPRSGRPEATPKAGRAAPASRTRSAKPGAPRDNNGTNRGNRRFDTRSKGRRPGGQSGAPPRGKKRGS
jgi:23S rRNA pseudouridine2605 synthase